MNTHPYGDGVVVLLPMRGMIVDAKLSSLYEGVSEFEWGESHVVRMLIYPFGMTRLPTTKCVSYFTKEYTNDIFFYHSIYTVRVPVPLAC